MTCRYAVHDFYWLMTASFFTIAAFLAFFLSRDG